MLNYIVQGIIQGLTEFLPVSSSGHLTLYQFFTGSHDIDANMVADIAFHFGTLLAVLFFFRADILPYFTAAGWRDPQRRKMALLIIISSVPTAIIGFSFKKQFKSLFAMPNVVAVAFLVTGLLLLLSEKLQKNASRREFSDFSYGRGVVVGIAQGLAITPGISRSGSTIATGLLLGLKGEDAARFSFLLSIPAVGGATLLELKDLYKVGIPAALDVSGLLVGLIASCITGFLALKMLVYIIKKQKLSYFAYYLFLASTVSLIMINFVGK